MMLRMMTLKRDDAAAEEEVEEDDVVENETEDACGVELHLIHFTRTTSKKHLHEKCSG